METCDCTDRKVWKTSNGATLCLHCARLDPTSSQPSCSHVRSKITLRGTVCSACSHTFPLLSALGAFQTQKLTLDTFDPKQLQLFMDHCQVVMDNTVWVEK